MPSSAQIKLTVSCKAGFWDKAALVVLSGWISGDYSKIYLPLWVEFGNNLITCKL